MPKALRPLVFAIAAVATAVLGLAPPAAAQGWPQRPVKFVVTLGAGSGVDIGTRLLADRLSARWGQPVVVENRPGGDGIVAITSFLSAHDDHVLLAAPTSSFTAHPYLHDSLPYKQSDLLPIARVSNTVIALSVPVSLQAASFADVVAKARAQPGKLNWAGVTGALDFAFAGFLKAKGLNMPKVPYRNPVEAANDVAEGRVQVYEGAYAIARPQIEAGRIKPIMLTNSVRAPMLPQVPTAAESGFPELTMDGLVGFFGPPGMPLALRERIASDVRAVSDATIESRLLATGQLPNPGGPAEFAAAADQQRARLAEVARDLGIKASQ
ncbi:MAG TPA: tripartite tricarboxylate transporter substrate binding protein [Xanthobacteraceae bacterium]|jgi:tripartite-type tricarboxylate transporter receptor subunit TctC